VKSQLAADFISCFRELPARIQRLARKNYLLWKENPNHPGVQFKLVGVDLDLNRYPSPPRNSFIPVRCQTMNNVPIKALT
jgi:hypothetical protein